MPNDDVSLDEVRESDAAWLEDMRYPYCSAKTDMQVGTVLHPGPVLLVPCYGRAKVEILAVGVWLPRCPDHMGRAGVYSTRPVEPVADARIERIAALCRDAKGDDVIELLRVREAELRAGMAEFTGEDGG